MAVLHRFYCTCKTSTSPRVHAVQPEPDKHNVYKYMLVYRQTGTLANSENQGFTLIKRKKNALFDLNKLLLIGPDKNFEFKIVVASFPTVSESDPSKEPSH